jgi:PQQ-dependent catabolism-associated CXXCW motif protein
MYPATTEVVLVAVQHRRNLGLLVAFGLAFAPFFGQQAMAGGDEAAAPVPEPAGYRMDDYRAPTPATLAGGTVLDTAGLRDLLRNPEILAIDVLPLQKRPDNLPADTLWMPKPRLNIPNSVWLPEVGRGALSEDVERYFRDNLQELSGGDPARGLVFYCLADCWMSWNAAKRAIGYGYQSVYWYPDGTDGWTAAGLPTAESRPVPMADGQPMVPQN